MEIGIVQTNGATSVQETELFVLLPTAQYESIMTLLEDLTAIIALLTRELENRA